MKTTYLFIGGVLDGQHVEVEGEPYYFRLPVNRPVSYVAAESDDFKGLLETHHYKRARIGPQEVFVLGGDPSLLINRYPLAGTINVNLEDLEAILETCEPPMIPTARPRFDLAVRRLYTALSNHNKQKDQ
jgi:hypothetical protein